MRVVRTPPFEAQVSRLAKKLPLLPRDLEEFVIGRFAEDPRAVSRAVARMPHIWKVRIGLPRSRISRSSGLRMIYRIYDDRGLIVPLLLYFKPEQDDVTAAEVARARTAIQPFLNRTLVGMGLDPARIKL